MKASRLIEILENLVAEVGDVDVYVPSMGTSYGRVDAGYFNGTNLYLSREDQKEEWKGSGRVRRYGVAPVIITSQYEQL